MFTAVMADKTTDIPKQIQLSITFCYIHNGVSYEQTDFGHITTQKSYKYFGTQIR